MSPIEQQLLGMVTDYLRTNPSKAVDLILFHTPLKQYLFSTLTQEQLLWFSAELDRNKISFIQFLGTDAGKAQVRQFFDAYKNSIK